MKFAGLGRATNSIIFWPLNAVDQAARSCNILQWAFRSLSSLIGGSKQCRFWIAHFNHVVPFKNGRFCCQLLDCAGYASSMECISRIHIDFNCLPKLVCIPGERAPVAIWRNVGINSSTRDVAAYGKEKREKKLQCVTSSFSVWNKFSL